MAKIRYRGLLFQSELEAQWAKFFDALEIEWVYRPDIFYSSNFVPDFYLPESDAFFEVKETITDSDVCKIKMFIEESGKAVTIGENGGRFRACNYMWNEGIEIADMEDSMLNLCPVCGQYGFLGSIGSYACPCCGAYDGDHFLNTIEQQGGTSVFWEEFWHNSRIKNYERTEEYKRIIEEASHTYRFEQNPKVECFFYRSNGEYQIKVSKSKKGTDLVKFLKRNFEVYWEDDEFLVLIIFDPGQKIVWINPKYESRRKEIIK